MGQKYRAITKDMSIGFMVGDQVKTRSWGQWRDLVCVDDDFYLKHADFSKFQYRRPITEQYVYENAEFLDTVNELLKLMNSIKDGTDFYDARGCRVGLAKHTNGIVLEAGGFPTTMQDICTRKPEPRTIIIGDEVCIAPETEKPKAGDKFYYIDFDGLKVRVWDESEFDYCILNIGIWLKEEHCQQVIDATHKLYFGGVE